MRVFLLALLAVGLAHAQGGILSSNARRLQGRAIQQCSPTDGQVLVWNASNNRWQCGAAGSIGGVDLTGLSTGLLKNTAGTVSIGIAGVDYALPGTGSQNPGYQPNQTIAGCGVEYLSALIFNIGACQYTIAGVTYNSAATQKTLSAADSSNPRIDVIGVDTSGVVFVRTGTPAASPQQPTLDPATQLGLTFVYVAAGATTPTGPAITSIYEENTEWTSAVTSNFNAASTSNPYRGSKDIEATTAVLTNYVTLTKPAAGTELLTNYNNLVFYIRSKATWPVGTGATAARSLAVFWLSGSTQIGQQVILKSGQFGFDSSVTSAYQQISIPVSLFGTAGNSVTTLKIQVTGNGGSTTIGFYIDGVSLQGGAGTYIPPATLMNFKGTWNASATYSINDVVSYNGDTFLALAVNTNTAVTTVATWQSLGSAVHSFTCTAGTATGSTALTTGDFGCYADGGPFTVHSITRADIIGNGASLATCSATVDVWLKSGAYPTASDKISASAPATLSSANTSFDFARTSWVTGTYTNPVFGASLATVTGCVYAQVKVFYQ